MKAPFQSRTRQTNTNQGNVELIGHNEVIMFLLCTTFRGDMSVMCVQINDYFDKT